MILATSSLKRFGDDVQENSLNNSFSSIYGSDSGISSEVLNSSRKGIFIVFRNKSESDDLAGFMDNAECILKKSGWDVFSLEFEFSALNKKIENGKFVTVLNDCMNGFEQKDGEKVLALSTQSEIKHLLAGKPLFDAFLVVSLEDEKLTLNEPVPGFMAAEKVEPSPFLIVSLGKKDHEQGGDIFNGLTEAGHDVFMYRYNFNLLSIHEITADFLCEFSDWIEYV